QMARGRSAAAEPPTVDASPRPAQPTAAAEHDARDEEIARLRAAASEARDEAGRQRMERERLSRDVARLREQTTGGAELASRGGGGWAGWGTCSTGAPGCSGAWRR